MNKADKMSAMPTARQVHCFPELDGAVPSDCAKNNDNCTVFQPLYRNAANHPDFSDTPESGGNGNSNPVDAHHSSRKQWYQQGYANGEKDARSMVHEELSPRIRCFRDSVTALSRDLKTILSTSGASIAALGEAIAEKVLGRPVQMDPDRILILEERLRHALTSGYRIELMMNPEDFKALTSMAAVPELTEDEFQTISIGTGCDVERGTILESGYGIPLDDDQIDFIITASALPAPYAPPTCDT